MPHRDTVAGDATARSPTSNSNDTCSRQTISLLHKCVSCVSLNYIIVLQLRKRSVFVQLNLIRNQWSTWCCWQRWTFD